MARRSAHSAAISLRRSSASSAEPWKEKDRSTVRPETGSTPTATRISQVPGAALAHGAASPRHARKSRDECRDATRIPAPRERCIRYRDAGLTRRALGGIRTPNLLIRSQML